MMKGSIVGEISELLSNRDDERSQVKLDVLRVLVVNPGSSWRSELIQDLVLLRSFKGEPGASADEIDNALDGLEKDGLLTVEEQVKGMMDGPREDSLISLSDLNTIRGALSSDGVLARYMHERAAEG